MPTTPSNERIIHLGGKHLLAVRWTAIDRAIEAVAPVWSANRLRARVGHALSASLGGWSGADKTRRSLSGWNPISGDADDDTLRDLPTLRDRSEDLVRNSPLAGGAIDTMCTHVVGTGLSLQASIDAAALGLSAEQAAAWHADVERKYNAWWETQDCDITRTLNGYGLQRLSLLAELTRGDCFVVLTQATWATGPVRLALQFIEADRCANPDLKPNTDTLVEGVEMDANGAPVKYHFASRSPRRGRGRKITWQSVQAFGTRTGRRNVLHLFDRNRINLTRGVPVLAPVIEPLKQLERYTEAELMAAVVSGMFTVFIKTEGSTTLMPNALGAKTQAGAAAGSDIGLGNGSIVELAQNESIETANPGRPNAQFAPFVDAIFTQVGVRLGVPKEVLLKVYNSSYTAAQASFLDAWRTFRTRRDRHAMYFCQPVYQAWLDEAVATGYVAAPGYFSNALVRRAWQGAQWVGDGPGAIRPDIAVESAVKRVDAGISTLEAESVLHDGVKWSVKYPQLLREAELMRKLREERGEVPDGMPAPNPPGQPRQQPMPPGAPDPEDPEDDNSTDAPGTPPGTAPGAPPADPRSAARRLR